MSAKVDALVYVKPEPLVSEQFEEAVKVARRDSVEALETTKIGMEEKLRRLNLHSDRALWCFLLALAVLALCGMRAIALRHDGPSGGLIFLAVGAVITMIVSVIIGLGSADKVAEITKNLTIVRLALQLKTRKEEIIALLP